MGPDNIWSIDRNSYKLHYVPRFSCDCSRCGLLLVLELKDILPFPGEYDIRLLREN